MAPSPSVSILCESIIALLTDRISNIVRIDDMLLNSSSSISLKSVEGNLTSNGSHLESDVNIHKKEISESYLQCFVFGFKYGISNKVA